MKKIIFLGDSITDASHCFLENPLGNGYVNMVAEKLNDSIIISPSRPSTLITGLSIAQNFIS